MKESGPVEIVDVFVMLERPSVWVGSWPLKKDYIKFGIFLLNNVITVVLFYVDLIAVLGNLYLMVENLLETLVATASIFMMVIVRFHPSLVDLIVSVRNEMMLNDYRSNEERYLYYAYNLIAYSLSKIAMTFTVTTAMAMYLKPLPTALHAIFKSLGRNATALNEDVLVIPFKGMQILHVTDLRIYFLIYIYRLPIIYLGLYHTITICLVWNLILHVCGRFSVLKHRVKLLETKSRDELEAAIRYNVQDHLRLIKIVKSIENIFQYILLFDLVQTSLRLGLSAYVALTSKDIDSEFMATCTFATYTVLMFVLLFVYCFVGEYLRQETMDLTNAYYHCNWQEMPLNCKSSLMICMICSQNHLTFTAGKFYKFTLYGYTGIVKTSMAYLSMLRAIV